MERLFPDSGPTTVGDQLETFDPVQRAWDERPYTYTNFALTVDGHATIDGRSGAIGSDTDTDMLVALRTKADAVMIGAGTMRAERYGRLIPDPMKRAVRERRGLPHDPLAVLVSRRLDLPWDAPMFTCGAGRVLIFTTSEDDPPETATPVRVVRQSGEHVDLEAAVRHLRSERGIRAMLCEGGPELHGKLLEASLVDELFITVAPMLGGGRGAGLLHGLDDGGPELELSWLLRERGELFARYRVIGR